MMRGIETEFHHLEGAYPTFASEYLLFYDMIPIRDETLLPSIILMFTAASFRRYMWVS